MKTATILPTHFLSLIEDKPYQMALAHLIGVDKKYTEFYKKQVEMGHYVILDNGVIETGVPEPIEVVVRRAKIIGASEIILPDVFRDGDATIESAYHAIEYVKAHAPELKMMIVPQGNSVEEWLDCAEIMLSMPIHTIGIPKVLTSLGGRDARLEVLASLGHKLRGLDIHLLGCWSSPIECTMIEKAVQQGDILPVRGVDSAIAYVYSREGQKITNGPRPSGEIHFDAKDADEDLLLHNIAIWEQSCTIQKDKVVQLWT